MVTGPVTRLVTVEAEDKKAGMTALELLTICPRHRLTWCRRWRSGLNGRIKKIKLQVE